MKGSNVTETLPHLGQTSSDLTPRDEHVSTRLVTNRRMFWTRHVGGTEHMRRFVRVGASTCTARRKDRVPQSRCAVCTAPTRGLQSPRRLYHRLGAVQNRQDWPTSDSTGSSTTYGSTGHRIAKTHTYRGNTTCGSLCRWFLPDLVAPYMDCQYREQTGDFMEHRWGIS